MPAKQQLPTREVYMEDPIPVAICSAAGPCPICREEYVGTDHAPVLLRNCVHIFGKPCILEWFEEGANTCPLDRDKLFTSITDPEEAERWSLVPFGDLSNRRGGVSGGSGRTGEVMQRTHQTSDRYMFFSGEIISVNGRITPEGCLRVVRDLWYRSGHLYRQLRDHPDNLDPSSVSEDMLRGSIHDALPRGSELEETAWPLLFSIARTTLTWQETAWEQGWEARMPREDMVSWGEELWNVCGGAHDGD